MPGAAGPGGKKKKKEKKIKASSCGSLWGQAVGPYYCGENIW